MLPTEFPRKLGEKLKRLREHTPLSPDELAVRVGATRGAEILAYAKEFGIPVENIVDDRRDLWFGHRQN